MARPAWHCPALSLALSVVIVALLTACGGGSTRATVDGPTGPDPLDSATRGELLRAARAEGSVVVYSFTSRIAAMEKAFEATYPGVDLVGHDISSTKQVARLKAENAAGSESADVAFLADAPLVIPELVDTGVLRRYVPPWLADAVPARHRHPLLANRLSTKTLLYNEEAFPNGSPVTNLWQVTEPRWRGRVVLVDPGVRGDYLDLMTAVVVHSAQMAEAHRQRYGRPVRLTNDVRNAGEQWIKDLYDNAVVLVGDTDSLNAAVGQRGQSDPPVGFGSYSDRRDNEDEGWALQAATGVHPAPGIAFPALLGVVHNAWHPAAARLFVDFAMGDDSPDGGPGYAPLYVAGDYPTRTDIDPPPDAASLRQLGEWIIDPRQIATQRDAVADFLITVE